MCLQARCLKLGTFLHLTDIRLVGGGDNMDRVEVFFNGTWVKVCSNNWDIKEATVACRQLGFAGALQAGSLRSSHTLRENEALWMDLLYCRGNESSLKECNHRILRKGYGNFHWCRDAGVLCLAGNKHFTVERLTKCNCFQLAR